METWDYITRPPLEKHVFKVLKENGYRVQFTANHTRDSGVDLIVNDTIAVLVKHITTGGVGTRAIQEVFTGKAMYGCSAACVVTDRGFTSEARELAEANGVGLVNHLHLQWLADHPDPTPKEKFPDHAAYLAALVAEYEEDPDLSDDEEDLEQGDSTADEAEDDAVPHVEEGHDFSEAHKRCEELIAKGEKLIAELREATVGLQQAVADEREQRDLAEVIDLKPPTT